MKQKSQAVLKRPGGEHSGTSPSANLDARIQRTRSEIDHAFVQLLLERSYRSLTVHDITRKAGVGRATFYAHYDSKDALLRSQMGRIIVPILRPRPDKPWLLECSALFEHVLSAPQLFRNIMAGGEGSGARVVRAALEERVQWVLDSRSGGDQLPRELVTRFVVSTLLAVVLHALQSKRPESPLELQSRFARLAGSGLGELG